VQEIKAEVASYPKKNAEVALSSVKGSLRASSTET
jgi:hypothetical protein